MTSPSTPGDPEPTAPSGAPTSLLAVKLSATVPKGATAVGEFAYSDHLNRIPGVSKAVADRDGFTGKPGSLLVLHEGDRERIVCGLGDSDSVGTEDITKAVAAFTSRVAKHRKAAMTVPALELDLATIVSGIAEAAMLANYKFVQLRTDDGAAPRLNSLTIATERRPAGATGVGCSVHGDLRRGCVCPRHGQHPRRNPHPRTLCRIRGRACRCGRTVCRGAR